MRVLVVFSLLIALATAHAESHNDTLKRVLETGQFRIGFVPDAPPLSFRDNDGNAVGYSIDLCRHIASAVRDELDLEQIDIVYIPLVSMDERLTAIANGVVDI